MQILVHNLVKSCLQIGDRKYFTNILYYCYPKLQFSQRHAGPFLTISILFWRTIDCYCYTCLLVNIRTRIFPICINKDQFMNVSWRLFLNMRCSVILLWTVKELLLSGDKRSFTIFITKYKWNNDNENNILI